MGHRLSIDRYRESLVADTIALAVAGRVGPDAHVPSCPEWDVTTLLRHLYDVQEFWRLIVEGRLTDRTQVERGPAPADEALPDALEAGARALGAALEGVDPEEHVYSWADEQTLGWVARRQAHEAAVHRWDGQNAVGVAEPIAVDLAVDGIDEWFEFMVEARPGHSVIHLDADDADAAWFANVGGQLLDGGAPDAVIRAPASSLLLSLWGRYPIADFVRRGDTDLGRALVAKADLA